MGLSAYIAQYRNNRKILLFIVYIALFLDNMLLTTVVPIIPEFLFRLHNPNASDDLLSLGGDVSRAYAGRNGHAIHHWDPTTTPPAGPLPFEQSEEGDRALYFKAGDALPTYVDDIDEETPTDSPDFPDDIPPTEPVFNATAHKINMARRHELLTRENVHVGLMFGSKAMVQLIANPFVGPLTNKIGYTIPMFTGFVIMFLSTLMFAFGETYAILFVARTLQGIGSSCTSTSGMGMLAQAYPDDQERGSVMGIALGGLALGVLIGPPFGGILYEYSGKELPFVLLAILALFDGTLQFLILQPHVDKGEPEGATLKDLAMDPYIIVAAGSITIGNLGIAMLEPSLPLWMMETMHASSAARGAAFLPASISYLVGTNIFGPLAHRIGRWLSTFIGLITIGFCLLAIPSAKSLVGLLAPNAFMGFGIGMIDASMFPHMGYLVDLRHAAVYGSIYAIADAAFCFAFAFGPFLSGPIVKAVRFPGMLYIIAIVNFIYAPFMFWLRNPPAIKQETDRLVGGADGVRPSGSYTEFQNSDVEPTGRPPIPPRPKNYDSVDHTAAWDE